MAWLEFELVYNNIASKHDSHYATGIPETHKEIFLIIVE